MASTYSSLKIQLMATGENSGTWGNVTNDNLGVAIEQALVETATVTFASANVTLTLNNTNASQTARALRLDLTGTTGGARDLIVPAIQKPYIVNNGTADTITVKVTGQTGVAVPAGRSYLLYNNGTDVVNAIEGMSVVSGGTGLETLTAESVVIGNGTNAVKFVAPGTTANVLTSNGTAWTSTALPASNNASALTTGTTAVNVGGTGQTSYTDGQLLIGNSTGNTLTKATLTAGTGINITNGTGSITIAASGGGGLTTDIDVFNSPGTFTTPANTTKVLAYVVSGSGGGGGGSFDPGNATGGAGGAGGSGVLGVSFLTVTGSTPYAITVGTGGAGSNVVPGPGARNAAGTGNASSFGNLLTANGGGGGGNSPGNTSGNPGNAGTSPLSQITAQPSPGAAAAVWSPNAGVGGNPGAFAPGPGGNGGAGNSGRVLIFY